jgi:aminopeptidase
MIRPLCRIVQKAEILMTDPRVEKLARTLVEYSVAVQPGETVVLMGDVSGLPLVRETYKRVVQAGGNCVVTLSDEIMNDTFLRQASDEQIDWISPLEHWAAEEAKVLINIRSTSNTRRSSSIDPKRMAHRALSRTGLAKIRFARSASSDQRWTLTQFPTEAYAQEADMSLEEFEDFVYSATYADQPDPVACWRAVSESQQKYVDWLKGRKNVVVRGPNVDLTLSIEGRTFINSDGKHNMPSGEIFTGPVENSANGWVRFTYPAIREGRIVDGVELRFKNGRVESATAQKNEAYLLTQIDSDPGARYLGEFAIGTNFGIQRFTGNILFDEKIGGSFHMALGRGYPETGSKNESAIHWDMICDMRDGSEITVDGELFYKNGQFAF